MIAMVLGSTTGRCRCHGGRWLQDTGAHSEAIDAEPWHVLASEQETGHIMEACLLCCWRLAAAALPDPDPRTRANGLCS